jgi:hypothetical protein
VADVATELVGACTPVVPQQVRNGGRFLGYMKTVADYLEIRWEHVGETH